MSRRIPLASSLASLPTLALTQVTIELPEHRDRCGAPADDDATGGGLSGQGRSGGSSGADAAPALALFAVLGRRRARRWAP